MANDLAGGSYGAFSPTYFSRRTQRKLLKQTLFRSLANFEEQATLFEGQRVNRPSRGNVTDEPYTKGTAATAQDLSASDQTMDVDKARTILMYVDNIDKIQNKYNAAGLWADEAGKRLAIAEDAFFLYEAVNAADTVDDGDVGGTAGNGITVSETNIDLIFDAINLKFDEASVPLEDRALAMSPRLKSALWRRIAGKESQLGDKTGEFGNIGEWAGIKLYLTNNLMGSARFTTGDAGDVANAETITIQGITFTFVSSIGSTAGNVLIGGTLATTIDNLVAFINAGGVGDGVSHVSLSTANKRAVSKWTAVDGTTYIEVRVRGASYLTVSNSQAADSWAAATQLQHNFALIKKRGPDMVIQQQPIVETGSTVPSGKWGKNIMVIDLFGTKTFTEGSVEMLDVQIKSSVW